MTTIIQRSFIKWADQLEYRPTDLPLVNVEKIEGNIYKIQAVLFVPSSSTDFQLDAPTVAEKTTEAGEVSARCFIITAKADFPDPNSSPLYALWSFEAVYEIDGDSQNYVYTQIVIDYPGNTPVTPRGTVTTVEDPDENPTPI